MTLYAGSAPHSSCTCMVILDQQFNRIFRSLYLGEGCWEKVRLKQWALHLILISLLIFFGPAGAIADQCVEGDCVNGKGTMLYSTGHRYVGEFKNGMRDGQGFLTMPGARTLEGQFLRNEPIEGTYTYPDGKIYTGQWKFRERNGWGRLRYPDGRVYEGDFKSGLRSGKGVMIWPDGRRYEGNFVGGNRTGEGKMIYPDGRVYNGNFLNGERTGWGVMTLPSGERLDGLFVDGKFVDRTDRNMPNPQE